jgi:hypothetical protein
MSDNTAVLVAEIRRISSVMADIHARLETFRGKELSLLGRTQVTAVFVAQVLDNHYTGLETLFLRISQFFENSLASDRWHADLLDKMMLHIPGVRESVLSEECGHLLHELLRFRHFKRYYFELDFDWLKLDYLLSVYERARPLVQRDLAAFSDFLGRLGNAG